ncbi:GNAT family N-acetyltransferase [Saccharopolyspora erythraea]|uniref:GNAT family N-acetyltransferase n=1 Tax=Saccharopolyspora erythraea TaxID=1836 RepID=UPI001F5D209E|nr:GNAT family N-acetyltransferase [Saccharopolyspora erythraea]
MSSRHDARGDCRASTAAGLRLRPLRVEDQDAFLAAHRTMAAEGFNFGLGLQNDMSWGRYLEALEEGRAAINLPKGMVPAPFLVADVGGEIVGRTSIRHVINDFLASVGGHIGYAVLPQHRRRGYATEILRQSLVVARAHGVKRVLVTCDDNIASIAVIEACGGQLDSLVPAEPGAPSRRRYWID